MEIHDAVVLVTGSSSGIGRATALAFDRAGARVALAARRAERLEEIAASMREQLALSAFSHPEPAAGRRDPRASEPR